MQLQDDTMGLCIDYPLALAVCMRLVSKGRGPAKAASYNSKAGCCRGQSCTRSMPLTSAPCSTRNFTVLKWPLCAHLIRGVSFICGSSQSAQGRV